MRIFVVNSFVIRDSICDDKIHRFWECGNGQLELMKNHRSIKPKVKNHSQYIHYNA